jgi:hypothetical protein
MNILKHIGLTLVEMVKQVWKLPETIAKGMQGRQRQKVVNEQEAERLDRIRNPMKYRGKE